jgi:autophagy-related protein 18
MQSKINDSSKNNKNILYLNFNQDCSCISIGTEKGFVIYNVTPFKEIYKRSNSSYK